ncbi:MAG TPA: hypothetical protein VGE66_13075 [Chitinophagaceae bacterium]
MKRISFCIVIVALFFLGSSTALFAQDKNLLARVAYEEAEKAFESGKLSTSYEELKKVDEYLGKVTPKAQFLRVQIWKTWAEEDGQYLENAIRNSKTYLAMDKTANIPEEKILEVTRWLVKLEKDKVAYDKAEKENAVRKAKAVAFVDSLYKVYHYTPDMTEVEFLSHYKEEAKKLKRNQYKGRSYVLYDGGWPDAEGLADVDFDNDKMRSFQYVIKYHATDVKSMKDYYKALVEHIRSSFPASDVYVSENSIAIFTNGMTPVRYITFRYSDREKRKASGASLGYFIDPHIQLYIENKLIQ